MSFLSFISIHLIIVLETKEKNQETYAEKRITHPLKKCRNFKLNNKNNIFSDGGGFYIGKGHKVFTTDLEVLKTIKKFNFVAYLKEEKETKDSSKFLSFNNLKKNVRIFSRSDVKNQDKGYQFDKNLVVHFIDACMGMSKFLVAQKHKINPDKLRDDVIKPFILENWKDSNEKDIIENYFVTPRDDRLAENLGMRSIVKIKSIFHKKINEIRKRLANKKLNRQDNNRLSFKRSPRVINNFNLIRNKTKLSQTENYKITEENLSDNNIKETMNDENNANKNINYFNINTIKESRKSIEKVKENLLVKNLDNNIEADLNINKSENVKNLNNKSDDSKNKDNINTNINESKDNKDDHIDKLSDKIDNNKYFYDDKKVSKNSFNFNKDNNAYQTIRSKNSNLSVKFNDKFYSYSIKSKADAKSNSIFNKEENNEFDDSVSIKFKIKNKKQRKEEKEKETKSGNDDQFYD